MLPNRQTAVQRVTGCFGSPLTKLLAIQVSGNLVRWQKWQFRVGFNYREGAVVYGIGYNDGGRLRPILHRMSMAEMAVPYGASCPCLKPRCMPSFHERA